MRRSRVRAALSSAARRISSLSPAVLAVLGVLIAAGVGGGGYYAYRVYDYVEHDNDFCTSCHLMADPFERFAESAHSDLSCKACHKPNLMERSQMALTQVVENPDELGVHALVPNEACAECHVDGDPEQWAQIAASAGHRVHFESADTALDGLLCVECHSTSVHEFTASDQTCAQSGCHTESGVRLGAMSDLTIHCASCHGFSAVVPTELGASEARGALAPDEGTCFGCHEMAALVDIPDPDPHGGECASCHNPHTQALPADAVSSCASAGCHSEPDTLTPYHRGLEPTALSDCSNCHTAHDFHSEGASCSSCHETVPDLGAPRLAAGLRLTETAPFLHREHTTLDCASCHESEKAHGAVFVSAPGDCMSCHHEEPLSSDCAACHEEGAPPDAFAATRTLSFSVGSARQRTLPFEHGDHEDETCVTCHSDGAELSAAANDCTSCHEEHHQPTRSCMSCHVEAPATSHPIAEAHLGCGGAGCHTENPFESVPRTRNACLLCHQDLVDHRPEGDCAACHVLPEARRGG